MRLFLNEKTNDKLRRKHQFLLDQKRPQDIEPYLADCEALASHEPATDQRKDLAVRTLVRSYEALDRTADAEKLRAQMNTHLDE